VLGIVPHLDQETRAQKIALLPRLSNIAPDWIDVVVETGVLANYNSSGLGIAIFWRIPTPASTSVALFSLSWVVISPVVTMIVVEQLDALLFAIPPIWLVAWNMVSEFTPCRLFAFTMISGQHVAGFRPAFCGILDVAHDVAHVCRKVVFDNRVWRFGIRQCILTIFEAFFVVRV